MSLEVLNKEKCFSNIVVYHDTEIDRLIDELESSKEELIIKENCYIEDSFWVDNEYIVYRKDNTKYMFLGEYHTGEKYFIMCDDKGLPTYEIYYTFEYTNFIKYFYSNGNIKSLTEYTENKEIISHYKIDEYKYLNSNMGGHQPTCLITNKKFDHFKDRTVRTTP